MPKKVPNAIAMRLAKKPSISEVLVPCKRMASKSRPLPSVPRKCTLSVPFSRSTKPGPRNILFSMPILLGPKRVRNPLSGLARTLANKAMINNTKIYDAARRVLKGEK